MKAYVPSVIHVISGPTCHCIQVLLYYHDLVFTNFILFLTEMAEYI